VFSNRRSETKKIEENEEEDEDHGPRDSVPTMTDASRRSLSLEKNSRKRKRMIEVASN
jgi:hypothetical protein